MITPEMLELAENANTYTPLGPTDERIVDERYVLWMGRGDEPHWNVAQRFRLEGHDVAAVREEIHEHLRRRGRTSCSWEVGSNASPGDLVDQLHALGLVDDEPIPHAVGMVLAEPLPDVPTDVEVRRIQSDEDRLASARIAAIAFGGPIPTEVKPREPDHDNIEYVAFVDGQPVARASGSFSEHGVTLFGGSTLPEARGRGAYKALIAARWEDAVERGTPALVTQASPMSRPILERLGFQVVCDIHILLDRFA